MDAAADAAAGATEGLIELAARGDEIAFAEIVRRHHADMHRVSFVVTGDLDVAEEAVASAWPIAWRRLRTLRDASLLRSWLCSIAANEGRQIVRRRKRRAVREIAVTAVSGLETAALDRSADVDLRNALARLSAEDRSLLALRYVAGLNSFELASALGMSPSGIRAKLARLLAILRRELGDD